MSDPTQFIRRRRGRPSQPVRASDRVRHQTVPIDQVVVRAVRHHLMKKEMLTGERFNMARWVTEACREKLLRARAEDDLEAGEA